MSHWGTLIRMLGQTQMQTNHPDRHLSIYCQFGLSMHNSMLSIVAHTDELSHLPNFHSNILTTHLDIAAYRSL